MSRWLHVLDINNSTFRPNKPIKKNRTFVAGCDNGLNRYVTCSRLTDSRLSNSFLLRRKLFLSIRTIISVCLNVFEVKLVTGRLTSIKAFNS